MISTRSKWLFCGVALAPIALGTIFSIELSMLHKIQAQHFTPQESVQYQLEQIPWLPHLIRVAAPGALFALAALVSLDSTIIDTANKPCPHL